MSSLTMRFHADYIFGEELECGFEYEYDRDSSFMREIDQMVQLEG